MTTQTLQIRCGFARMWTTGRDEFWCRLSTGRSFRIFWKQIGLIEPGLLQRLRSAYFGREFCDVSICELRALIRLRESRHAVTNKR